MSPGAKTDQLLDERIGGRGDQLPSSRLNASSSLFRAR
jgi:hypothetical protein